MKERTKELLSVESGGARAVARALATAGLTRRDITLVPLQHAAGRAALDRGQVDARAGLDPFMAEAELASGDRLFFRDPALVTPCTLLARDDVVANRPEIVRAVIAAYAEARLWAIAHPDALAALLARASHLPLAVAQRQLARTRFPEPGVTVAERDRIAAAGPILAASGSLSAVATRRPPSRPCSQTPPEPRHLGLLLPVFLLLAWQAEASFGLLPVSLLPPPLAVLGACRAMWDEGALARDIGVTRARLAAGFAAGAGVGTILGALTGASQVARRLLDPLIGGLRSVPSIAWVPLFILWFGIFETSKVLLIAVGVFFPVDLNLAAAIASADGRLLEVGRVFGLGRARRLLQNQSSGQPARLCHRPAWRPGARLDVRGGRRTHGRVVGAGIRALRWRADRAARAGGGGDPAICAVRACE